MSGFVEHVKGLLAGQQRGVKSGYCVIKLEYLDELFRAWCSLDSNMRGDYYNMEQKDKELSALKKELETLKASRNADIKQGILDAVGKCKIYTIPKSKNHFIKVKAIINHVNSLDKE